jgi:uncharacterized integral membrane protein
MEGIKFMRRNKESSSLFGCTVAGCIGYVILFALAIYLAITSMYYNLDFWGRVIVQHPIILPVFAIVIMGIVFSEISIPLAIIAWVIHLFWLPM